MGKTKPYFSIIGTLRQKLLEPSQKDEESQPQEPDSEDFTCEICIEPVNADKKFKNNGMCKHSFCSDCIAKYIEAKVVEFNTAIINCPALQCQFSLDPLSCRPIISNQLFDKWCELLCHATVLQYYEYGRSCYCPKPNCSALILNECNDEVTKSTCPSCKRNFCFRCKSRWHAGYSCNEWRNYIDWNDVIVGWLIEKKKWTRCPKCGHAVQRNGGCITITCRCGNRFCHACGATCIAGRTCCRQNMPAERNRDPYSFIPFVLTLLILFYFICTKDN